MLSGSKCWFSLPNRRQNFTNCLRQPAKTNPRLSLSRLAVAYFPWWAINCRLADFYCGNITETDWENPQPRWAQLPETLPVATLLLPGVIAPHCKPSQINMVLQPCWVMWPYGTHLVAHGTRLPSHSARSLRLFMTSQVAIVGWQIGLLCSIELQLSAQVDNTVDRSARHVDGAINCRGKRGAGSVRRGIRLNRKCLGLQRTSRCCNAQIPSRTFISNVHRHEIAWQSFESSLLWVERKLLQETVSLLWSNIGL